MHKQVANLNQKIIISRKYSVQKVITSHLDSNIVSINISQNVKNFEQIPRMNRFKVIRGFLPKGKYFGLGLNEMHRKIREEYGNIVIMPALFGRPEMIFTYNDVDNEKLLRSESHMPIRYSFESLKYFREKLRPDIYGGEYGSLASENGEKWYKIRSAVNPIMLPPKTVRHYTESIDLIAKDFLRYIQMNKTTNEFTNRDLNLWSLESIGTITLDRRLGLFSRANESIEAEKLVDLIRKFFILCVDFEVSPSVWKYYHTKAFKEFMQINNDLLNIIMSYIEDSIEKSKIKAPDEKSSNGILQQLLKIDKKVAIIMAVDAMLAGIDTTSSAIIGIMYCLSKNADKQQQLRDEIKMAFSNFNEGCRYKSFQNMPYLRACVKEGLRLYPPVSGTQRTIPCDLILSGYHVPKGSQVVTWPQLFYRQENIFPQSNDYLPERWLKKKDLNNKHLNQSTEFHFLPFGHGVRSCIGRRLANLEIELLLINILKDYQLEWCGDEHLKTHSVFVNVPIGDVRFRINKL